MRPRKHPLRPVLVAIGLVVLVLLGAAPAGGDSDLFQNVGPASQLPDGALMDAFPLGHYALDHHFPAIKAGVFSGVDVSGLPPTIAWFLAQILWQITAFLAQTTITLFTFAFSLDLVNGSQATGGRGALEPVSRAVRSIYDTTFGAPWLSVAIVTAGLWAIWQSLVRRRYTQTAGSLAVSVLLVVLALGLVMQPQRTIGEASRWSNAMSGAFLSLTRHGTVTSQTDAKRAAADQLFALLVYQPWTVLQFGGLEHCVKTPTNDGKDPVSVAVRPLAVDPARDSMLASRLRRTGEVTADGKACVNNERKYAVRFLRFPSGAGERDKQYEALKNGDTGKLADTDPAKQDRTYHLGTADRPAADAMGKGGQYQRLLLALLLFLGELGVFLLLGALSIAVILAQVLVLLLLAFAPVALVLAVLPGRGHAFFLGWLTRLATFLLRKALYSLILAVLLAVGAALGDASASLGWLMAFGLQAVFYWAVLLYRHQLVGHLTLATTGRPTGHDDHGLRLARLYAATHALTRLRRHPNPSPTSPPQRHGHHDRTALEPLAPHVPEDQSPPSDTRPAARDGEQPPTERRRGDRPPRDAQPNDEAPRRSTPAEPPRPPASPQPAPPDAAVHRPRPAPHRPATDPPPSGLRHDQSVPRPLAREDDTAAPPAAEERHRLDEPASPLQRDLAADQADAPGPPPLRRSATPHRLPRTSDDLDPAPPRPSPRPLAQDPVDRDGDEPAERPRSPRRRPPRPDGGRS